MNVLKKMFLAAAALISASALADTPVTPYTFTPVVDSPIIHIAGDKNTYTSFIDTDGERVAGGIFQVWLKDSTAPKKQIAVIAMVAVCNHDSVIMMYAKEYVPGKAPAINDKPILLQNLTSADPALMVLKTVCAPEVKSTPINPGYKAPARYTSFWAKSPK